MDSLPPDHFVKAQQFTPTTHRDVYPAIDPTSPTLSQAGKAVIITGASRGLGAQGWVPGFAAAGAKAIKDYPKVETLPFATDIADPASVAALFEKVKEKYGHADVLVNNAGIFKAIAPVKEVDQQAWWDELTRSIRGTFLMTQSFLKLLPTPTTLAKIITLTTGAAYEIFPSLSAYGLSKLAVLELMTYLAAWEGVNRGFLNGRFVSANWDFDDLVARKEEIEKEGLLKMDLKAKLGAAQFEK
ncbi:NAD(P)-binding protein [Lentithecium fluviatile CBS 122367]|uniref:NAD(P)-binding protein n=1 Tax=Lentithecium fluviatile CBS 122367 TaxID=1168545 RepID=A0A6G1J3X1_9PLEO|nr:NAD(P)-binding protein [Lentithecium fluviatile CBS 122367]